MKPPRRERSTIRDLRISEIDGGSVLLVSSSERCIVVEINSRTFRVLGGVRLTLEQVEELIDDLVERHHRLKDTTRPPEG